MSTRINDLGSEEFSQLFTSFQHTAYRLETLQAYDVGYERASFRGFLAGRPVPHDPGRDAWGAMIRNAVGAGKVFQRVHVVREPLTDYLRYEMDVWYRANTAAGDDVRILPAEAWPEDAPHQDYWLFDSRDLWVMNYADDGTFQYAELENDIDSGWTVADAGYWRDAALHNATPFPDYLRNRPRLQAS